MSRKLDIRKLSDKKLEKMSRELQVCQEPSKYAKFAMPKYICMYEAEDNDLYVPFSYKNSISRPERDMFSTVKPKFEGTLREEQKKLKNEALESLNKCGAVLISAYVGFGKTATSIYMASKIRMKTLVICHRVVLVNQWKDAIERFCPKATVQILSTKSEMKDCDFYIMNAINVVKKSRNFFSDIGLLIIDEAHLIMAERMSHCMRFITPRYVIGLSATPYRTDGLNEVFDLYFGKKKIIRKLFRKHTVYKVSSGFKPKAKMNKSGRTDWDSVLAAQASDPKRNELIVNIIQKYKDRVFLVLCKRVIHANTLVKMLTEKNEDVTSLIGSQQTFEKTSRILVGTASKVGVGFDHSRLDTLLLAADIEQYFIQYLGRVFRRKDVEPVIFDIVDSHGILHKHFETRQKVYTDHGGIMKRFPLLKQ